MGLLTNKGFWNVVKPFLTYRGFLRNGNIAWKIEYESFIDEAKLVNLFNSHYIKNVENTSDIIQSSKVILTTKMKIALL